MQHNHINTQKKDCKAFTIPIYLKRVTFAFSSKRTSTSTSPPLDSSPREHELNTHAFSTGCSMKNSFSFFNAKLKAFRTQFRDVLDIKFFLFRVE